MRILFLGNNWVGWQIVRWLRGQGEEIVGVVVHPSGKQKYGEEIIDSAFVDPRNVFDGSRLSEPETFKAVKALQPELGISALFGYILCQEFLELMPAGCVNIHPALLPYNRGAYPNVWSIVEETPAGVTVHYIDEGMDTGEIIAQRQVEVNPFDTGKSLYHKLEESAVNLFKESWPLIRSGQASRISQNKNEGTCHRVQDIENIDEIDLDYTYTARELINIIRARTFPPYPGAYFWQQGWKVYLRLQLLDEEELRITDNGMHD